MPERERIDMPIVTVTGTEAKRVIINRTNCPEMVEHREAYFAGIGQLCDLVIEFFDNPTSFETTYKDAKK